MRVIRTAYAHHAIRSPQPFELRLVAARAIAPSVAMAAFDHVVARLQAVQRVLTSLAGAPAYSMHVSRHAATLRQLLTSAELLREMRSANEKMVELVDHVHAVGFPADVEADLVGTLHDRVMDGAASGKGSGGGFQDYTLGFNYIGPKRWEYLVSKGFTKSAKLSTLISFFVSLGLTTPSERTFGMLTGIYLCCIHSEEALDALDSEDRKDSLKYVKGGFEDAA